jgi:hydroxymethylglutaryl-CoA reductase
MSRSSRIPGFYKLPMVKRLELLAELYNLSVDEINSLASSGALSLPVADKMVENAVGIYSLPIGLGLNFKINDQDYLVPMAIEEPSVIASASYIAKIVREAGGFVTESTGRKMRGQIQILDVPDWASAAANILEAEDSILELANQCMTSMVKRGGGARAIDVRFLNEEKADHNYQQMLIVDILIDTCDAMGANTVNTVVEGVAPLLENLSGGRVLLKILTNYTDQCLAKSTCRIPVELLKTKDYTGEEVRDGVIAAFEFADSDFYRAVTHNKGVMNGVDAVVIATGNDWRAIEAAAHAHAARSGRYRSMTRWFCYENGDLGGELELPMPVGIIGGSINLHPMAQIAHKFLGIESAEELASVVVSVGLAQNLGALKALATEGIQKGHMALHARSVALSAGATPDQVEWLSTELINSGEIKVTKALELLATASHQN